MQRMTILGLSLDIANTVPMVLLKSESSEALLLVWLGASEALHLAMAQAPIALDAPLVHEAIAHCIQEFGGTMLSCSVLGIREGVFVVTVEMQLQDKIVSVPCRFIDGVALALRMQVPIYVATHVLDTVTADRGNLSASPEARRPSDMVERLVGKMLPEQMQEIIFPKKKLPAVTITQHTAPTKRKEIPESIKDRLLREMEPASRRIM